MFSATKAKEREIAAEVAAVAAPVPAVVAPVPEVPPVAVLDGATGPTNGVVVATSSGWALARNVAAAGCGFVPLARMPRIAIERRISTSPPARGGRTRVTARAG